MSTILIIANVLGYIGLGILFIQTVFGSRHIFKYFTTDNVLINKLHQYLGTYGVLLIFAHPLAEMMVRLEDILWVFTPSFIVSSEVQITLGRFALFLLLLVWITSAIVREKIKWRPWKYLHLLSYPIMFLSFVHVLNIGTFFQDYALVRLAWGITFIMFLSSLIIRLRAWAGMSKAKYKIIEEKLVGEDILLVKLQATGEKLPSTIGQHFYIQTGNFQSEHPFTIIRNVDGVLSFGIRRVGKFWDKFLAKKVGELVSVDGPYGVFTREAQNTNPKVIISAGVGFTPFIDLVEKYGENTTYINCNRKLDEVVERDMLKAKTLKYVDVLNTYDGQPDPSIFVGLINKELIKETVGSNWQTQNYFICGSPGFIKVVKGMLKEIGVPAKNIYLEELGF